MNLVPGMAALSAHVLKLTMYVQNQDYDGNITVSPGISTRWWEWVFLQLFWKIIRTTQKLGLHAITVLYG